ncbi:MAG: antiviral reverse transcriptase Drt2 [Pseudomonadales bacterium]
MDWYRPRKYLHFDQAIGEKKAFQIATNPEHVAKHAFKPFLSYEIQSKKIAKIEGQIKTKEKKRPISFAAHVDSHIYSYYCSLLTQPYESLLAKFGLGESILAFRKLGKSNIDFAFDAFQAIKAMGECTAIGYDISGFFDHINHALLKSSWCRLLDVEHLPDDHFAVFKSLTKYSSANRADVYKALGISTNNFPRHLKRICTPQEFRELIRKNGLINTNQNEFGMPQGSPISAFLSNVYMLDFDLKMHQAVEEQGGRYFRYCDDMLFIIPTSFKSSLSGYVVPEIKNLKLSINVDKTEICDYKWHGDTLKTSERPLQYLGFLFDGQQVLLRSAGLARYSERMKRGVRLAKKLKIQANKKRINKGQQPTDLYKHKLYERYSHLGRRNFIRYGLKAAHKMKSKAIRKQIKPRWGRLQVMIERK